MKLRWYRCLLPDDPETQIILRHMQDQGQICIDHAYRRGGRMATVLNTSDIAALEAAGIDVERTELPPQPPSPTPSGLDIATGFTSSFLDVPNIHAAYTALQAAFPALTSFSDLPEPSSGYDGSVATLAGPSAVKLFRITTTPTITTKPAMLVVAGLHAREWAPPLAALEFAAQLLNNYSLGSPDPEIAAINAIVEQLDTLIVVAANPDGINYSHHDFAMWRKNRRPNAGAPACPGVDLNRNFSIYWGQTGSSPDPCSDVHRGSARFSEVEARNIRFLTEQFPNLLTAIDCHSFGEDIFRPQITGGSFIGAEPVNAADNAIYVALEAAMNAGVASVTPGKVYSTGTTSNHSGTFDEYMFFAHRIFGMELEIGQDFQPPITDALLSAREGAAAMRNVATETLNLAARFITPVAIAQVIDRSGSMNSSGYVDATRANAKRLIDLMSLNDTIALASFAGTSSTDFPATAVATTATYAAARAAVDAISFGGSTSIGAGLQRGLTLLPPPGNPRAIILLSDGYENNAPMVNTILPTVPTDVDVHTIALGPASDQMLLQQIAADTGGTYHFAPDEMGLFEIYNAIHAASTGTDMAMSDMVDHGGGDSASAETKRRFVIDCDADYAEISISGGQKDFEHWLRCLSLADCDLSRVQTTKSGSHRVLRWRRPQPGVYELAIRGAGRFALAVFVRSPVRARLIPPRAQRLKSSMEWQVAVESAGKAIHDLSLKMQALAPQNLPITKLSTDRAQLPASFATDALPEGVARQILEAEAIRKRSGIDPLKPVPAIAQIVRAAAGAAKKASFGVRVPVPRSAAGSVNIRIEISGRTANGCAFTRTVIGSQWTNRK